MAEPLITLFIETPNGVFVRRILPASLLAPDDAKGPAAESATRNAASRWGLPDFVFRPVLRRRGAGVRELGDAIVVAGDRAACVQIKARDAPLGSDARERAWLDKAIADGARQGTGTIRSLRRESAVMINERGRRLTIVGSRKKWLNITVLDHPGIDGYMPSSDSVVLLRRDWEFLFDQLKSTYAVLEYAERIGRSAHEVLGHEPIRYYELAAADLKAPKGKIDDRLAALGPATRSVPLLPMQPVAHGEIIRGVLEDITTCEWPGQTDPADVLEILAAIDAAPVAYRAELGRDILSWLQEMPAVPVGEVRWRFRRLMWPDRPHLIFGAAPRFNAVIQDAWESLIRLRHQQHLELMPERSDLMTVGILLTPRADARRAWDTTVGATTGEQEFEPDFRSALERLWGPFETHIQPGTGRE
jgi:hypothetical protein